MNDISGTISGLEILNDDDYDPILIDEEKEELVEVRKK